MGRNVRIFSLCLILFLFCLMASGSALLAQRFVTPEEGACHHLEEGEIDEAIEILQKILEANPANLNARLYFGVALYLNKNVEGASLQFEKVEKEVDKMLGASRPFGDEAMFTQLGMDRKSDILFTKQREGLLYFCRGLTLKEGKDFRNAEKKFKKALKLEYDEKATRLQLFDLYIKNRDEKKATQEVAELKKMGEEPESLAFLEGYLAYRKGNDQEALTAFMKIASSSLAAKGNMALIHYNSGDYQKAIGIWEGILSEHADDKESLVNIGRAHFHLGDIEKAQECFTRVGLNVNPTSIRHSCAGRNPVLSSCHPCGSMCARNLCSRRRVAGSR